MDTTALNTVLRQLIGKQRRYEITHKKSDDAVANEITKITKLIIDTHECYLKERMQ